MKLTKFFFRHIVRRVAGMVFVMFACAFIADIVDGDVDWATSVDGWVFKSAEARCFVDTLTANAPVVGGKVGCDMDDNAAYVVRVVDGDTMLVKTQDGDEVYMRLRNIDAPEMSQGDAAELSRDRLSAMAHEGCGCYLWSVKVMPPQVRYRQVDTDRHGRPVVYMWNAYGVDADDPGLVSSMNYRMVADGYAFAWRYGGGDGYDALRTVESSAVAAGLGVHNSAIYPNLARPEDYKAAGEQ